MKTHKETDSALTKLMLEYNNRPGKDDLRKAQWDLCTHVLYAAAANGDEGARAFVKKHNLKFNFGPQIDIDTVKLVPEKEAN